MKARSKLLTVATFAMALVSCPVFAQDHDDHHDDHHDNHRYVRHDEWKHGETMRHEDWARGERVDYRRYHLNAPPRGYEWREVDGNYVMAAIATGVISSVVVAAATAH